MRLYADTSWWLGYKCRRDNQHDLTADERTRNQELFLRDEVQVKKAFQLGADAQVARPLPQINFGLTCPPGRVLSRRRRQAGGAAQEKMRKVPGASRLLASVMSLVLAPKRVCSPRSQ